MTNFNNIQSCKLCGTFCNDKYCPNCAMIINEYKREIALYQIGHPGASNDEIIENIIKEVPGNIKLSLDKLRQVIAGECHIIISTNLHINIEEHKEEKKVESKLLTDLEEKEQARIEALKELRKGFRL